ncbi:hypothetical protein SAMN05216228_100941 [Rhizobium tibeticum]|uniref:Uncharacterized protein n=1 Tax=Rhizobium tibeticum TaxID=501024 RepID=A0A1H8KI39_9HYPH|nr:hypothetical protein RTCCBAU85039_2496 [Rhizobium tibeticum]SEN92361.1 hypothetical protein SAMN05216228_100941 [Rhizobium tibeticum]
MEIVIFCDFFSRLYFWALLSTDGNRCYLGRITLRRRKILMTYPPLRDRVVIRCVENETQCKGRIFAVAIALAFSEFIAVRGIVL